MLALEDWDSRLPAHTHTLRAYRHNLKTIPKGAPPGQLMRNRRVTRRGQISNEKSASVPGSHNRSGQENRTLARFLVLIDELAQKRC